MSYSLIILRDRFALESWRSQLATTNDSISGKALAFVPTMGALHRGHKQLVIEALHCADAVLVSIFVNPTQFCPGEDYTAYPRMIDADLHLLEKIAMAEQRSIAVYIPEVNDIYPTDSLVSITVPSMANNLCGAVRPGHFDGVGLVVLKLLNRIRPSHLLLGEKDWQQLMLVKRIISDLDLTVRVIGVSTIREEDGLAYSSRNQYLNQEQRAKAPGLYAALLRVSVFISTKPDRESIDVVIESEKQFLLKNGFDHVDYLEWVDDNLNKIQSAEFTNSRLLAAVRLGKCRLIDNVPVFQK
jgi:pantoate--beta-alanine ligase